MNVYINVKLSGRRLRPAIFCPPDDLEFRSSMTVFEAVGGAAAFGRRLSGFTKVRATSPPTRFCFVEAPHLPTSN
jgi:hypothetical protein